MRIVRPLVGFTLLGVLAVAGWHLLETATARVASREAMGEEPESPSVTDLFRRNFSVLGGGYTLSELRNLKVVDYRVKEQYVDAGRIDNKAMFRAALEQVEREVPEVLLKLDTDGRRLHVSVGGYSDELLVGEISSFASMENELKRVAAILEAHLDPDETPLEDVEYALINGMLSTLDPHSVFLPPVSAAKMEEDNEGEFGGLGITIQSHDGQLTVEYPLEDTPAFKSGIRAGDKIVRIDGEGTLNMDLDEAVRRMRGAAGTSVTITIDREEFTSPRDFTIVREMIKPSRVWGRLLDGNVGYVRIDQFHALVAAQLTEELARLERSAGAGGLKGLVIDMRDNPGGYLNQAVAVADTFLDHGDIVSVVERGGKNRDTKEASPDATDAKYPLAVLMSGNSASAAEIVAGALRNQERAVIIGERSFGKGSVQNLYPFPGIDERLSQLKLTVARYLTPGDHSIQNVGIPADIELQRSVVYPPKHIEELNADSGPRVSLFYRDRVLREADLQGHLVNEQVVQDPLFRVRYLTPDPDADDAPKTDRKDVTRDFEVMAARDVLLAARGSRRADILREAGAVLANLRKKKGARIDGAFQKLGIDWSACANPDHAELSVQVKLGTDGTLHAGELEPVTLIVTNTGTRPLCQVAARSKSGNDNLDGVEYYFGKLAPGQARSYTTKVRLADAYPTELSAVNLEFLDATGKVLATEHVTASTTGTDVPRYAWSWAVNDVGGGDGDGIPEVGETLTVKLDVKNVGSGPGGVAELTLKKGEGLGKEAELVSGKASFSLEKLAPGASASGEFQVKVLATPPEGALPLVLRVKETERYDYASIVKAGFYSYLSQEQTLELTVGKPAPAGKSEPPAIQITRAPGLTAPDGLVTVSGVATDDVGVRDVIVYHGAQKVAYAGGGKGGSLASVPFTATTSLDEGNNLIVVLVRDVNGFTTTRAVDVYRPPTETSAQNLNAPKVPGEAAHPVR